MNNKIEIEIINAKIKLSKGILKLENLEEYINNLNIYDEDKDSIKIIFKNETELIKSNLNLVLNEFIGSIKQFNYEFLYKNIDDYIIINKNDIFKRFYDNIYNNLINIIRNIKDFWLKFFTYEYFVEIENNENFSLEQTKIKYNAILIEKIYKNKYISFISSNSIQIKKILSINNYYFSKYFTETNNLKLRIIKILYKFNKNIEDLKFTTRHFLILWFNNFRYYLKINFFNKFKNSEYFYDLTDFEKLNFFKKCIINYNKKFVMKKEDVKVNLSFECPKSIYFLKRKYDLKFAMLFLINNKRIIILDRNNKLKIEYFKYFSNEWKVFEKIDNEDVIFKYYYDKFYHYSGKYAHSELELKPLNILSSILEEFIFTNDDVNKCFKKLEINKNLNNNSYELLKNVPFIGGTIFTVLEFYDYKKIITSDNWTIETKINETISTVGKFSVFFSLVVSGGIIGQTLIPIPVLGGVIGTVIGGLGSKLIEKKINNSKIKFKIDFINLIKVIRSSKVNGFWKINNFQNFKDEISYIFEITKPRKLDENIWLTIICFILLSLYEDIKLKFIKSNAEVCESFYSLYEKQNLFLFEDTINYLTHKYNILLNVSYIYKFLDTFKNLIKNNNIIFNEKEIENVCFEIFYN